MGPKKAVGEMIEERGGIYAERLTSETDYLVVASVASRDWTQSSEGRKIQQALEMRRKGAGPEILQEVVLRKAFIASDSSQYRLASCGPRPSISR